MIINTHTRESMMLGICDYFSISPGELVVLFEKAGREAHKNTYLDYDILNKIIEGFIDSNMPSTKIVTNQGHNQPQGRFGVNP